MRFKFLALFVFLFFAGCELLVSLNESSADSLELEVIKDDLESLNENESRIFFTKDLKGFIDICGCSEDMAGGLPRIASLKSKYQNSIWVDLGNWAHDEDHKDPVVRGFYMFTALGKDSPFLFMAGKILCYTEIPVIVGGSLLDLHHC